MNTNRSVPEFEEAHVDPAAHKAHLAPRDNDILGHRSVYVGINNPNPDNSNSDTAAITSQRRLRHKRRGRRSHHGKTAVEDSRPVTSPSKAVQFILGDNHEDAGHQPHPLFSELEELSDVNGVMEWHETARWVKFEEEVEEGGNRWSKPHVATLSLHSLFELRSMLLNGTVCLDMAASNLDDISELLLDNMINSNLLTYDKKAIVKDAINKRHRHLYQEADKPANGEGQQRVGSNSNLSMLQRSLNLVSSSRLSKASMDVASIESGHEFKGNNPFMKKIPKGAEASNILVGELNALDEPLSCFIRLSESRMLGDLTEVPVPTRFIFILLGPAGEDKENLLRYHEVGRSMATILSDEVFNDVVYKAKKREHLLAGLDEFLDAVTVLPPGEWDPSIRIEPPTTLPSQMGRKQGGNAKKEEVNDEEEERKQSGLVRTGRLFGGLIDDVRRKRGFYLSDFKDGLALQSLASFVFIYFACLTPIITFGGLLGDATDNRMSAIESLVAGMIAGVSFALFSGQPLTLLGSTGPILVFETILYNFCKGQDWNYLSFRLCIGMWILLILLILVALDASAFVCYITRFTEENFATLIAFIFIVKAFEKVLDVGDHYPLHRSDCFCAPQNETELELHGLAKIFVDLGKTKPYHYTCQFDGNSRYWNGTVQGVQSVGCHYVPNAFLMSLILFFGTFLVAFQLKKFKTSPFFPATVKNLVSDFAVLIAIVAMTLLDFAAAVDTPKLHVPGEFRPTWEGRGWLIHPLGGNPWWTALVAVLPAILGTILIFMDQQITAVIVNRKEHRLKKGCGYHLDLFVVAIIIAACSVFGLPWFVAATVLSINHVKSLTKETETAAPGEKPQFLGIREQRLTHLCVFVMIGLSVLITPALSRIPMPVLYGVFLYMGVASLNGIQFFDRILLILMPKKYQPDLPVLRRVPLRRVHLFTAIQLLCLIVLWVVKEIKHTSILFPIMLLVMIGVRKALDKVFLKSELKVLDDILPEFQRQKKLDDEENLSLNQDGQLKLPAMISGRRPSLRVTTSSIGVPMANGNMLMIPVAEEEEEEEVDPNASTGSFPSINITEEVNRSGVWTSLEGNNSQVKRRLGKRRMSIVAEVNDDQEDHGITIKASLE